jgi:hypothetical protein
VVYILYRSRSEHERQARQLQQRLQQRRIFPEMLDVDSREGAAKSQTYAIMQYPAVLAVRDTDGQVIQTWSGQVPTVSDVEFFARSNI